MKITHPYTPPKRGYGLLDKSYVHIILIALLGLLAYSNTFDVPFQWDDKYGLVVGNPIIKDLCHFLKFSTAHKFEQYGEFKSRYIGYLTFALNYRLHGLNVTGYHIVNLMIHIVNAVLVYLLVILTFGTPFLEGSKLKEYTRRIALSSGVLFVVHPLQTEAVTYIYQRFTALVATFYLGALALYVKWRLAPNLSSSPFSNLPSPPFSKWGMGGLYYLLSLLAAVLAMKTKENAFTLPLAILLYELMFFENQRPFYKRIMPLLPFFLTMLIIPLTIIDSGKSFGEAIGGATKTQDIVSRYDYFFTQCPVIVTYLRLFILPINQTLAYEYPIFNSIATPQVFFSLLFLLSIFIFSIYLHRRSKKGESALSVVSFGIMWFFLTLSVESSVIALADVIFEHRIYLPSFGLIFAITSGAFLLFGKINNKNRKASAIVFTLIILILSYITLSRNTVWRSEISLWEDTVEKSFHTAKNHYNLALAYTDEGLIAKAIEQYKIAIFLAPDFGDAHFNLAKACWSVGQKKEAVNHFQIVLGLDPDDAEAHYNLGLIYLEQGMTDLSQAEFEAALRIKPSYYQARSFLAFVISKKMKKSP